jgi:hypothetical protein
VFWLRGDELVPADVAATPSKVTSTPIATRFLSVREAVNARQNPHIIDAEQ